MDPQVVRDLTSVRKPLPQSAMAVGKAPAKNQARRKREPLTKAVLQSSPLMTGAERTQALRELEHDMLHCFDCNLCKTRAKPIAGQGNPNNPDIMFIGPAPDVADERNGMVFSGPAGDLLTKMIEAMKYKREDLFLTNICKCRPDNDRAPLLKEMKACTHFLEEQIRIVRPKVIVVLGEHAIRGLFLSQSKATSPQGAWTQYHGLPVMPTFHPKYILRFQNDSDGQQRQLKSSVWRALKSVMQLLNKTKPSS